MYTTSRSATAGWLCPSWALTACARPDKKQFGADTLPPPSSCRPTPAKPSKCWHTLCTLAPLHRNAPSPLPSLSRPSKNWQNDRRRRAKPPASSARNDFTQLDGVSFHHLSFIISHFFMMFIPNSFSCEELAVLSVTLAPSKKQVPHGW